MYANNRFPSLYIHIYTNTHKALYIESRTITTHSITKKKEREKNIERFLPHNMSNKVHVGSTEMEEGFRNKKWKVLEPSDKIKKIPKRLWDVGKEDPRRVIHALKVGISLTLVSLLYLMEPLFKDIGSTAIWAVMTVVVVLEFSAGTCNQVPMILLLYKQFEFINVVISLVSYI